MKGAGFQGFSMSDVEPDRAGLPYGEYVVWFMRGISLLWLAKGVMHWFIVLGVGEGEATSFLAMPPQVQSAIVLFAVFDLVAAVGLWLAAPWGGVLWLLAAGGYVLLEMAMPQIFGRQVVFIAVICVLILVYFFLMFMASRSTDQ